MKKITRQVLAGKRPTISELEQILTEDSDELSIEIQPDGSIRAVEGKPNHATPKIYTLGEVLGGDY